MSDERPRLLDLFCGAGGCARGYQEAGFHVTGVDLHPQPRYCGDVFIQADALTFPLEGFAAIHASPPCQGYSRMRRLPWLRDRSYPLLLEPVRQRLTASGVPYVIENVEDAPLQGGVLCGQTFGLKVYRHRRFETSFLFLVPSHQKHREVIGRGRMLNARQGHNPNGFVSLVGHSRSAVDMDTHRQAMGIDWMTRDELSQAIPPAYTRYLGQQLMTIVRGETP